VAHTAEQFPQLCEAEAEVFSRLLGTHVQRLATIAHGDGVCTTFIPTAGPTAPPAQAPRARGTGADTDTPHTDPAPVSTSGRKPA
jgi:hypothetical protein